MFQKVCLRDFFLLEARLYFYLRNEKQTVTYNITFQFPELISYFGNNSTKL